MNEQEIQNIKEMLKNIEIDDDIKEAFSKFDVVYVKHSKYGKAYAYLIDEDVDVGNYVYVPDRDEPLEVIKKEIINAEDLPVPFHEMKTATLKQPIGSKISKLMKDNPILKIIRKKTNLVGRKDTIEDLLVSINKKRMRNSILIGNTGCGKTTIVEEFSDLVKEDYIVLGFNVGELIAGTTLRGMLEERLAKILNDVLEFNKKNQIKVILFVDEFHMITQTACNNDEVSMHDILKTYMTNPNMILIGATTIGEYNKYVKKDVALMRRISPIYVNSLNDSTILQILVDFSNHKIDKNLLSMIIKKSKEIPNTSNPDISLEIVDRLLAKNEVLGYVINEELVNTEINKLKTSYEMA